MARSNGLTTGDGAQRDREMIATGNLLSGPVLIGGIHGQGLPGLLAWTVGLAAVLTGGYYAAKGQLLRNSPTRTSSGAEKSQDPSQAQVFGLFLLIAVLVFALLLATHFVPGT